MMMISIESHGISGKWRKAKTRKLKGTKESQKRTSFVAGGPNTTDEKWPKYDASNSQTVAYFPANLV
jgi:hypothetical protein